MTAPPFSVSVVVPIYNEIELAEPSLRTIHAFLKQHVEDFEIVIVESGSTDGTGEICDRMAGELSSTRVFHEGQRNGMGAALRLGYEHAAKQYVWLVTADLPFPLEALNEARPLVANHDCVLSYRVGDKRSLMRLIQSTGYAILIKTMLGLPMKSVNSAFKLLPRRFVLELPLISRGWFIDAELLYWISLKKLRFAEIGVPLIERTAGKSSVTSGDWIKVIKELMAFKKNLKKRGIVV